MHGAVDCAKARERKGDWMRLYLDGQKIYDQRHTANEKKFSNGFVGFEIPYEEPTVIILSKDDGERVKCTGKYKIDVDGEPCMILEKVIG